MAHTFYQVISADEKIPGALRELKHRCLNPGMYASHLESWLDYYSQKQVGCLVKICLFFFHFCLSTKCR
jgi:hypothetical protein